MVFFFIKMCLVAPVLIFVLCEDGINWIGCCELSLLFILDCVLTNIYATLFHSIPNMLPS